MRSLLIVLSTLLGLAGCCSDAGACPQNLVAVRVVTAAAPDSIALEGGAESWSCSEGDGEALCTTAVIPAGEHSVTVTVPGQPSQEVTVDARVPAIPPFSCDCAVPGADVSVEFDDGPPPMEDAGSPPDDAGSPPGDAG